jgi:hypothetical protein
MALSCTPSPSSLWPTVAVNLAVKTIIEPGLVAYIAAQLEASGASPGDLTFELSESDVIANLEHAQATYARLRDLGARIALDDFGSGFSPRHTGHPACRRRDEPADHRRVRRRRDGRSDVARARRRQRPGLSPRQARPLPAPVSRSAHTPRAAQVA